MKRQICIDVARDADVPDLAFFLNRRGIGASARGEELRLDVPGDGVSIQQVMEAVEEWVNARKYPFVPARVSENAVVLRPPAS